MPTELIGVRRSQEILDLDTLSSESILEVNSVAVAPALAPLAPYPLFEYVIRDPALAKATGSFGVEHRD